MCTKRVTQRENTVQNTLVSLIKVTRVTRRKIVWEMLGKQLLSVVFVSFFEAIKLKAFFLSDFGPSYVRLAKKTVKKRANTRHSVNVKQQIKYL